MQKVSEVYKHLYHYTNFSGLSGILRTQSLWATHCKFLNDFSEFQLMKRLLEDALISKVTTELDGMLKAQPKLRETFDAVGGIDIISREDAQGIISSKYEALGDEIYVTSFCGKTRDQYINDNGLLGLGLINYSQKATIEAMNTAAMNV